MEICGIFQWIKPLLMQADLLFTAYNCVSDADLKIASLTSPHCSLWSPHPTKNTHWLFVQHVRTKWLMHCLPQLRLRPYSCDLYVQHKNETFCKTKTLDTNYCFLTYCQSVCNYITFIPLSHFVCIFEFIPRVGTKL